MSKPMTTQEQADWDAYVAEYTEKPEGNECYWLEPDAEYDEYSESANDWYRHQGVRDNEDRIEEAHYIW